MTYCTRERAIRQRCDGLIPPKPDLFVLMAVQLTSTPGMTFQST